MTEVADPAAASMTAQTADRRTQFSRRKRRCRRRALLRAHDPARASPASVLLRIVAPRSGTATSSSSAAS